MIPESIARRLRNQNMKRAIHLSILFFTVFFISSIVVMITAQSPAQQVAMLKINKEYDKRTIIKKSLIPNAGNGLFAVVKI